MARLGIAEEQFRTLGLVPLVEVAWADGQVPFAERSAIVRFAKRKGWLADGGDALLDAWLKEKPAESFFEDARGAFVALMKDRRGLGNAFPEDTVGAVLAGCREVASASGGLFGMRNPIVPEEEKALQRIADTFSLGDWREAVASAEASATAEPTEPPDGHFLLGSLPDFSKDPLDFMTSLMRERGDVAYVKFGPADIYFLAHPDGIKRVYMDNHRNYRLPPSVEVMKEFLGDGLLTTDGENWRTHRRMIQPAFHHEKLAAMADTMTRITEEDLGRWLDPSRPREPLNMMDKFMELTLRVAGVCLFGMDLKDDVSPTLKAATFCIETMSERTRQFIKLPLSVPTEKNRRFIQARATLDEIVLGLAKARREGKTPEKADVLQLLLNARDEDTGAGLNEKELRDELLTMMGAGTETTALTLMWTCYFLSKYPAIRRAAEEEVSRVLGGRAPTLADTRKMPFLKQVLDETMRLRPPFYIGSRIAVGEDVISGVKIKPGAICVASMYALQRHPEIWPNPEGFDPDRFSPENSKDRHPLAFIPFGAGPKKCIGVNFATMEMQLVLPMVLQKFELRLLPGIDPAPDPVLTLRAKGGMFMTLHPKG